MDPSSPGGGDLRGQCTDVPTEAGFLAISAGGCHGLALKGVVPPTHTVTATAGDGGTIEPAIEVPVTHGTDQTFAVTVEGGYEIDKVLVDDEPAVLADDGTYTFVNVTQDHSISVTFKLKPLTFEIVGLAVPEEGGTVTGGGSYEEGASVTLSATANAGYKFSGWYENGDPVGNFPAFSIQATADCTIEAHFTPEVKPPTEFTLTYRAGPGGSIVGAAQQTVEAGESGSPVMAVPDEGYQFVKWSDGSKANPRADINVRKNVDVQAEFLEEGPISSITLILDYSAGRGGTIQGPARQEVEYGGAGEPVAAVPDSGHSFVKWSDGKTEATRVDTDVTVDVAVKALFTSGGAPGGGDHEDRWWDIPDQTWVDDYGITVDQAAEVAEGYPDGSFRPYRDALRAHCAKMIVDGFKVPTLTPEEQSFKDVPPTHYFYPWIEGGCACRVLFGYEDHTFCPTADTSRQQFNSMLGRILRDQELKTRGGILGSDGVTVYTSFEDWYLLDGAALLSGFADQSSVAEDHMATTAYLILKGIVKGRVADGLHYLDPLKTLARVQSTTMIARAKGMMGG